MSQASAAQCLDSYPDSAWQVEEPKDIPLKSDLVRTMHTRQFTNVHGYKYQINDAIDAAGTTVRLVREQEPLDTLINGLSIAYHLSAGAKETVSYSYKGANCQDRSINIERLIKFNNPNLKTLDLSNNQVIIDNFFVPTVYANFVKLSTFLNKDYPTEAFKSFVEVLRAYLKGGTEATDNTGSTDGDAWAAQWIYEEYAKKNLGMRGLFYGWWPTVTSPDACLASGPWNNGGLRYSNFDGRISFPKNDASCIVSVYLQTNDGGIAKVGEFKVINGTSTYRKILDKAAADKAAADAKAAVIKKTTITCLKGKLIKKVTAVNPVCPKGYKKK